MTLVLCGVIEQGVYELKPVGAKMYRILSTIHYGYIGVPIDLYTKANLDSVFIFSIFFSTLLTLLILGLGVSRPRRD